MAKAERIFFPNTYYVATKENKIVFHSNNINDCKDYMMEDEMLLVCLPYSKPKEKSKAASKIVVDFDRNILTVEGGCVTIDGTLYKEGSYDMDYTNWDVFVTSLNKVSDVVEYIGTPQAIKEKEITDEMSDL